MAFVDTDLARTIDQPKLSPEETVKLALDGLEAGLDEVLADDRTIARQTGPVGSGGELSAGEELIVGRRGRWRQELSETQKGPGASRGPSAIDIASSLHPSDSPCCPAPACCRGGRRDGHVAPRSETV